MSELVTQLKRHEGLRLFPYQCSAGKWTIGYGRNLDDVGISEKEAELLLINDIEAATKECKRNFDWFDGLSERRKQALVNLCFNIGINRLKGFKKMLKALKEGEWQTAHDEALDSKWAKQVGQRANEIAKQLLDG